MAEKTTVAFRVDDAVKEEWENAAERPEYDSLSHLIRLAVQREIADTEAPTATQEDSGVDTDGEVLESLSRLERITEEIQEEVEATARESRAEELYDLEQVLLEVLPTTEMGDLTPEQVDVDDPEYDPEGMTPEDIAARIGADEGDVSDTLNRLHENTGQVERREIPFDSQPRYVRKE